MVGKLKLQALTPVMRKHYTHTDGGIIYKITDLHSSKNVKAINRS